MYRSFARFTDEFPNAREWYTEDGQWSLNPGLRKRFSAYLFDTKKFNELKNESPNHKLVSYIII